jgi:glutamine amidotransferase
MSVSVISYGLGNLGSVVNMLRRIGAEPRIVTNPEEIESSERLLLPGVGAFDSGMTLLCNAGLADSIRSFAATGRPLLGICLGMQLLLDASAEGDRAGLGLVPGRSERFDEMAGVRVPHIGWNSVTPVRSDALLADLPIDARFYFVHSYRVVPESEQDVLATTHYGSPFASMIRRGNIVGAQFHPEKSHAFGMKILSNFAAA